MKKFKELTEGLNHKVPVYHADRKTLVGHVSSGATSIGAAKLAKKKSATFSRVNGIYSWVASDDLKESVWESYRDQALLEAAPKPEDQGKMLHCFTCGKPRIFKDNGKLKCPVCGTKKAIGEETEWMPLKGHPYHTKTDSQLHSIIQGSRIAAEKADRIAPDAPMGQHDPRIAQKHRDNIENAASILFHRKHGGRQLKEETEREAASHSERMKPEPVTPHFDAVEKVDANKQVEKASKPFDGSKMKHRAITSTPWIKGIDHMKEEHQSDLPNPGRVMDFHDHQEHAYHGGHEAKTARDAYAKHLKSLGHTVKKGSIPNQIFHGNYGNVYTMSHKRNMDESFGPHNDKYSPKAMKLVAKLKPLKIRKHRETEGEWKVEGPKKLKESEVAFNESGPEAYKVGDKVIPKIGPHKGQVHRVIHVHPTGHLNITPDFTFGRNQYRLGAVKADPKDVTRHLSESIETYKVGDRVVPKIGPHKGEMHRVIHVHPTGHLNITPTNMGFGRKNRYRLGAAKAHPNDVTKLDEAKFENTYCSQCGKDLGPGDHGCSHCSNHRKTDRPDFKGKIEAMKKAAVNRKTVQEIFQAAKDKKKGENLFAKKDADKDAKPQKELVDNLPTDGANETNKDVGAQPPQFGKKEGGEEQKQNNTPKPEKKTGKIEVQGPGPDDKFQSDPIVSPLTCMPDTASPRSGSQGVR